MPLPGHAVPGEGQVFALQKETLDPAATMAAAAEPQELSLAQAAEVAGGPIVETDDA